MKSPYEGKQKSNWKSVTKDLVARYPIPPECIVEIVLKAWDYILITKIGGKLLIGKDIFPSPQVMGNFLHEMIPSLLAEEFPEKWAKNIKKEEKDLVYLEDDFFSTELKTSSDLYNIFGNASYGVEDSSKNTSKVRSGYYLCVNFEKFDINNSSFRPSIQKIRLGWIDHEDWHSQAKASGQQARISAEIRDSKLILLYDKSKGGLLNS